MVADSLTFLLAAGTGAPQSACRLAQRCRLPGGPDGRGGPDGKSPVHAEETRAGSRCLAGRSRKGSRVIPETKSGKKNMSPDPEWLGRLEIARRLTANGHRF
jgi:hypothetical protein